MAGINFDITGNNRGLVKSLEQAQRYFNETARIAEKEGGEIEKIFDKIRMAAVTAVAGFNAKEFARKMMDVRGEFQQMEIAFTTMLQSEEKANELMNQLVKTAATTPFDLKGVADGAKQLMAYGTAAEDVNETIVRLGDIAAGMSLPLQDLVYLYGTTMVQGRMFTQDLRQFMGRGIPIAEEIAKILNVTKESVADLVTDGKVTDEVFRQAIENMTNEGSKFGGLMEAQSKTISGQISNIEDAVDMMFNNLGQKSEGVINTALGGISTLVENYMTVGKIILTVVSAYGAYKGALLAVVAIQKAMNIAGSVSAFLSLAKTVTSAKEAMLLFNMATKANPIGMLLSVVSAAAMAFGLFRKNAESAAEISEKFGEKAEKATVGARTLLATIENTTPKSKAHTDAIKELVEKYKEYGIEVMELDEKMSNEAEVVKDLTSKHNDLMVAIRAESIERQKANAIQTYSDEYDKALTAAWDKMKNAIGGDNGATITATMQLAISDDDLRRLGEAAQKYRELNKESKFAEAAEYGKEYRTLLEELESRVAKVGKAFKLSSRDVRGAQKELVGMGDAIFSANTTLQTAITTVNQGANAIDGYSDAADRAAYANRLSKMSVSELKSELRSLIDNYNNTTIGVRIVYDEINVPSWMIGMDLKETRRLAENFTEMLRNNPKASTYNVNGKTMTRQEVTERAVGYTKATEQKQAEADRKQREKDRAAAEAAKKKGESTSRKAQSDANKAQNEARRKAEEEARKRQERFDVEQRAQVERLSQEQASADAMEKAKIAMIQNAGERQRAEEDEQHRLNLQAIDNRAEEMKRKRLEALKEEWEANNTDKTKVWADTSQAKKGISSISLSKDEQAQIDAETTEENARWERVLSDRKKAEAEAMREYLKQYGDYHQQRLSIEQEYTYKITEARTEGEKLMLAKQKEDELRQVDERFGLVTQAMADLFADASKKSVMAIQNIIDKYEALVKYMEGHKGSATESELSMLGLSQEDIKNVLSGNISIKELTDRLKELKGELKDRSSYKAFVADMKDIIKQFKEAKNAKDMGTAITAMGASIQSFLPEVKEFGQNIANIFGADDSKISAAIDGFDGLMTAGQGFGQIMAGDVVGGVMSAAKGISQMVDAFDGMFGADYSSYERMLAQYERLIDVWETLIDMKSEYIEMSYGKEATKAGQEAIDIIERQTEAYRNLGREWLNSGASIGSHSQGVRQRKNMDSEDWKNVARALGRTTDNYAGLGGRLVGLFDLTSEQLKNLKENAPEFWAKLNDETQKYLQGIIDGERKIEDIQKKVNEQMTSTSFDSLKESFASALYDMEATAADAGKSIGEAMFKSIVDNFILGAEFDNWLNDFYAKWAEKIGSGTMSKSDWDDYTNEYQNMMNRKISERDQWAKAMGYTGKSAYEQDASSGGWQTMSQDTADELNGRFTALQMAGERVVANTEIIASSITILQESLSGIHFDTLIGDIKGLMLLNYDIFCRIDERMEKYYKSFDTKLRNIEKAVE